MTFDLSVAVGMLERKGKADIVHPETRARSVSLFVGNLAQFFFLVFLFACPGSDLRCSLGGVMSFLFVTVSCAVVAC